ncbi:hypothetical protein CBS101457_002104 [Exobasidium rhododendri]|nr:hypothetical protein CBS101457_002104 [Exobasidium rhododendri]
MTITLPAVAVAITPTVIKTFFQHYITQMKKDKEDRRTEATDEFMFHEAFAIVKQFIEIATTDTVQALQNFTNTQVPAPVNTTCIRMLIPMRSCNQAAALLIEYFGEKDLKELVGGKLWWQVRGLKGVQGEWIAMKKDWKRAVKVEESEAKNGNDDDLKEKARNVKPNRRHERKEPSEKDKESSPVHEGEDEPSESFEELDRLKRVMYYIHGGGYYFGSTSTHRLMVTRFARKIGGRAFAVAYRLSPQYPWPCPVQDILAGYLYLIDPPPEARHTAIDPSHIVIAGDSAGGGLVLALLGILRDLKLPMPSGAVLLSPWCDMTHSFPSILQNTDTDIIPPYSFIHKPSTLWPVPGVRPEDKNQVSRTRETKDKAGKNDAANPPDTKSRKGGHALHHDKEKEPEMAVQHGVDKEISGERGGVLEQEQDKTHLSVRKAQAEHGTAESSKGATSLGPDEVKKVIPDPLDHLYADPVTIPMKDDNGKDISIELRQQIQLYATNAQLYHPLCSPILQGSLGGLPPLYILAGNSEVLRDEIIYLAHRAARPEQYPLKKELLEASERCRQDAQMYNHLPTKVHLQVYDGQPHVLTLFSFTTSARYAYRAVASFVKHVTGAPTNVINPFPHLENGVTLGSRDSDAPSNPQVHETMKASKNAKGSTKERPILDQIKTTYAKGSKEHLTDSPNPIKGEGSGDHLVTSPLSASEVVDAPVHGESLRQKKRRDVTLGTENAYDGQVPLRRPSFFQEMIRERVDIRGQLRPLEEEHHLQALQMDPAEIGRIKSGPVNRYLTGQKMWDKKFKRTAKKVDKKRAKNEARAVAMLEQAAKEGLLDHPQLLARQEREMKAAKSEGNDEMNQEHPDDQWADLGLFGPLDLAGEVPPPSAIAGRRDTHDALELLYQSLHMRADRLRDSTKQSKEARAKYTFGSHRSKVRGKTHTSFKAHNGGQSTAERQADSRSNYGLRAWGGAMNYIQGISNEKLEKEAEETRTEVKEKGTPSAVSE